ncbi:MAG: trypsin-like peptidase domain-containing protein [Actinobacteria bacterium]|nr:trypsin-like peptidase domain-containing protein [Actinomycetota bacterium]
MKSGAYHRLFATLLALLFIPVILTGCGSVANQKTGLFAKADTSNVAVSVADKVSSSVVAVITRGKSEKEPSHGGMEESLGSGIVFRPDGFIITNAHVITDPDNTFVGFSDGTELKAKVIGTDTFSDIAIIKVDKKNLPVPTYGESKSVKAGQTAIAIGNPFGFENTVTEGIISATRRSIPGGAPSLTNMLQTDAAISPGNSGGALANKDGKIIGIATAFIPPQSGAVSLGFAIPVDVAKRVGNQLIDTGKATHAFLGLTPETLTSETAGKLNVPVNQGAVVKDVVADGPADKAGLKTNDVIVKMDGLPVRTADDVFGVVNGHAPEDEVEMIFFRGADQKTVTVTLGERTSG